MTDLHDKEKKKEGNYAIKCNGGLISYEFCMTVDEMQERGMSEDDAYNFAKRMFGMEPKAEVIHL